MSARFMQPVERGRGKRFHERFYCGYTKFITTPRLPGIRLLVIIAPLCPGCGETSVPHEKNEGTARERKREREKERRGAPLKPVDHAIVCPGLFA